jgi:flagellar P-ring protein precursor FlgI
MAMTMRRSPGRLDRLQRLALIGALGCLMGTSGLSAQEVRVRDLTVAERDVPVRLMGYGLVVGLDGTGDRVIGGFSSGHTVRSVANMLRRFGIEVPEQVLRTRNVAAVVVTAEASPYLRPGGRMEVHVSSLGDAMSLRGGVLWMTPLVTDPGNPPVGTAQGPLLISEGVGNPGYDKYVVETTARIPDGGVLEQPLPTPDFSNTTLLYLRTPDLATAGLITEAINADLGDGSASVLDPGAIALSLQGDAAANPAVSLAQIGQLLVTPERRAQVIIDGRDGTVVAGGGMQVGEAVVSHGNMTLTVGASAETFSPVPGDLRMTPGTTVQEVAAALHAVAAPPTAIAAVFASLREIGALSAEVVIR